MTLNALASWIDGVCQMTGFWESLDVAGRTVGTGSCWAVSRDVVATNHHVIAVAPGAQVSFEGLGAFKVAGVIAEDRPRDLALVRLDMRGRELQPLKVNQTLPARGEDVFACGHPSGLQNTVSRGIVSAVRKASDLAQFNLVEARAEDVFVQIDAAISPGSSGGPVVNSGGVVVAVSSFGITSGNALNFAIPVMYVAELARNRHEARGLEYYSAAAGRSQVNGTAVANAYSPPARTAHAHLYRLLLLLSSADGDYCRGEIDYVLAVMCDACGLSEAEVALVTLQAHADVGTLGFHDAWVDSLIALRRMFDAETRHRLKLIMNSMALCDGRIDERELSLGRVLLAVWDDCP